MAKYKKIELEFHDHSVGIDQPIACRVVGYLIDESKNYYKLSFWIVDTDDNEIFSQNLEPFSILKSTVIKKRLLK